MTAVTRVWIEEGCIVCNLCESTCPEVFHVTDETCLVNPGWEGKGVVEGIIEQAADECPVSVIKFE